MSELHVLDGKVIGGVPLVEADTATDYSITGFGFRRKGDIVYVEGTGVSVNLPAQTWTALGTLRSDFVPDHDLLNIPITGGSLREYTGIIRIRNGVVEGFAYNASVYFAPCFSYVAKN